MGVCVCVCVPAHVWLSGEGGGRIQAMQCCWNLNKEIKGVRGCGRRKHSPDYADSRDSDNSSRMGHGRIFISHTSLAASRGGNTGERRGQWRCLWEAVAVAQVEKDDGLI